MHRQLSQQSVAFGSEVDGDLAAVNSVALPLNQSVGDGTVNQFYRAVMADLQALRDGANAGLDLWRKSADGEQQLVLLRVHAGGAGRLLAEGQKFPDLVPEFGQRLVIDTRDAFCHGRILPVDARNDGLFFARSFTSN